jgi:hypothetical protein
LGFLLKYRLLDVFWIFLTKKENNIQIPISGNPNLTTGLYRSIIPGGRRRHHGRHRSRNRLGSDRIPAPAADRIAGVFVTVACGHLALSIAVLCKVWESPAKVYLLIQLVCRSSLAVSHRTRISCICYPSNLQSVVNISSASTLCIFDLASTYYLSCCNSKCLFIRKIHISILFLPLPCRLINIVGH